ncbi:hypothetical protein ACQ4PT_064442 [Festuca glaucescens]
MEKPRKPSFPPHRRLQQSVDVKKSSSSLNMSTSSLRSINEDERETAAVVQAGRRPAVVRFAPPTPTPSRPSSSAGTRRSSLAAPGQAPKAMAPAPAATARPASASGRKAAARSSPAESGPKGLRRSWGWTATAGEKEREDGAPISAARVEGTARQVRSSSVPRRMPADHPCRNERAGPISFPGPRQNQVSTSTTKGASWESLPTALQTLGSGVMSYRDAAEMAAVEAMQEASAAEIVLRCLSAFADLAASAAKQSPQHTVDEFFALQAAITRSTAALDNQQKRSGHAGEWLHAAVTSNLAPFSLYAASSSSRKHGTGSPRTVAAAEESATWLESVARELGDEMCAWFVGHVERLLDDNVAGTLGQLKRVNDWLDDDVGLRPGEALERLRKKIFGYLLDHVESAVVALNGGVATKRNRRK